MAKAHTLIVIFGITGDLASRKLLPALANIAKAGRFEDISVLGVSRRNMSIQKIFSDSLGTAHSDSQRTLVLATDMLQMDIGDSNEYKKLKEYIQAKERSLHGGELQVLYYLSVPPSATLPIIELLGKNHLNGKNMKLLLEKPFGFDLASGEEAIEKTAEYFSEEQVYRIDHFLAKEMAQNIIVFRATNAIFSNLWDKECIEAIDIIASEQIGIEGRVHFYEQTGALRDVLQNHLMQLLALTLMETPNTLDWQVMPQLRALALSQIEPADPNSSLRGQYTGYRKEVDNPGSSTETFVAVTVFSNDPVWEGVPIRLITGKSLGEKTTEIRVHFKKKQTFAANTLRLRIQPNEGVEIDLWTKRPGYDREFQKMDLVFDYKAQAGDLPDAYEQVIIDAIASNKSLFAGSDEVLGAWKILAPLQKAWAMGKGELIQYEPGSSFEILAKK